MKGYSYLSPVSNAMPPELMDIPRWVCWKAVQKSPGEKPTKVPYCSDLPSTPASSTNPDTWGEFWQAVAAYEEEGSDFTGIGFPNPQISLQGSQLPRHRRVLKRSTE